MFHVLNQASIGWPRYKAYHCKNENFSCTATAHTHAFLLSRRKKAKKKQAENIVNATIMKFRRYQSRNKWWNHILRPKYLLLISARISSQKKLLYNITSTSHESLLKWLLLLLLCRLLVSLQTTEPTMRKNENMVRWEFYAF